jgi:hypothetical protein
MAGPLLAMALGSALTGWIVTWIVAWRYGRLWALVVPALALLAVGGMVWRTTGAGGHDAMGVAVVAMALGGPSVAGALLGLFLAPRGER